MGVGAGIYMCDVVKKSSRSLSHLLMSSCLTWNHGLIDRHGVSQYRATHESAQHGS